MIKRAGFSLLEVLVALLISALVMTSVLGSLDYTQQAVDAIYNVIETENAGPRILEAIREDLSRIAIYDHQEYQLLRGQNESIRGFDADWIDFLVYRDSTIPVLEYDQGVRVTAPLNEVGYRLRMSPVSPDFMEFYRREDILVDEEPYEGGKFSLLYDRVTNFEVIYFKKPELDPSWEDDWNSQDLQSLPFAIEIQLEIEIQPRVSAESLGILGANRSRLSFTDIVKIPERSRWLFRQRLHPKLPEVESDSQDQSGAGGPGDDRNPDGGAAGQQTGGGGNQGGGGGSTGGGGFGGGGG